MDLALGRFRRLGFQIVGQCRSDACRERPIQDRAGAVAKRPSRARTRRGLYHSVLSELIMGAESEEQAKDLELALARAASTRAALQILSSDDVLDILDRGRQRLRAMTGRQRLIAASVHRNAANAAGERRRGLPRRRPRL